MSRRGLALSAGACFAQDWPNKPVRVIVPFMPGGPVDIIARIVGAKLNDALGQQFVVENRAGAGGNIGAAAVAKSAPDGYTVLMTSSAIVVNASLYSDPGYNAERDFIAVAIPASQPNMIIVTASEPARTLPELISQSQGKKIAFASPGSGTTPHLTGKTSCASSPSSTSPRFTSAARGRRSRRSCRASRRSAAWRSRGRCRR